MLAYNAKSSSQDCAGSGEWWLLVEPTRKPGAQLDVWSLCNGHSEVTRKR